MSTTVYAHSDVDAGELLLANDEDSFVDLEAEDFGLEDGDRGAVDFDEALAFTGVGDSRSSLEAQSAFEAQ